MPYIDSRKRGCQKYCETIVAVLGRGSLLMRSSGASEVLGRALHSFDVFHQASWGHVVQVLLPNLTECQQLAFASRYGQRIEAYVMTVAWPQR
jgi:hypothetical protein